LKLTDVTTPSFSKYEINFSILKVEILPFKSSLTRGCGTSRTFSSSRGVVFCFSPATYKSLYVIMGLKKQKPCLG